MTTIEFQVEESKKKAADEFFASLGFDTPTALNMFLDSVIHKKRMPFDIEPDEEEGYICAYGHLHRYADPDDEENIIYGPFGSIEEMLRSLKEDE